MYTNYNSQNAKKEIEKDPNIYVTEKIMKPSDKLFSLLWKILLIVILLIVIFLGLIKFGIISLNSEIAPEAVLLNQNEIGIKKGMGYQFVYTVLPDNSTNKQVVFESSDPSVVRVNETTGYVEALKYGSATITVKTLINEKINECQVKVSDKSVNISGVNINEKRISLAVGYSSTLSYKVTPSNATDIGLVFTTSDKSVATVNSKGKVTGIKPGTAIITVSAANGTIKDSAYVTVYQRGASTVVNGESIKTETYPASVNIKEESMNLKVGSTNQLTLTVSPSTASNKVTWTSSNSRVASVNQKGLVTATGVGTTTIVAKTINGKTDVCTIKVGDYSVKLKNVDITTNYSLLPVGITKQLFVAFIPSNASNKSITWSSSNPSVATVDSSGNIKTLKAGTVTITAQAVDGGFKDTATIEVVDNEQKIQETGISFKDSTYSVGINSTLTLIPTITPSNATYKTVDFTSDNPSVATVDNNGVVRGVGVGKAVITATTRKNKKQTSVTVNVSKIPSTGVTANIASITMPLKETFTITSVVMPDNASDKTVTYKSKNTKVVTVDSKGVIKAVGTGSTNITVTPNGGGTSTTIKVKVNKSGDLVAEFVSYAYPFTPCCSQPSAK